MVGGESVILRRLLNYFRLPELTRAKRKEKWDTRYFVKCFSPLGLGLEPCYSLLTLLLWVVIF